MTQRHLPICDTHVHVFDPDRFSYARQRKFTPGPARTTALVGHLEELNAGRVVLVQPSVYGFDHWCLLDALSYLNALGVEARGVCVLGDEFTSDDVARLDRAGVRAARLNLVVDRNDDGEVARQRLAAIEGRLPRHWHVQLHVHLDVLRTLAPHFDGEHRRYVLDHIGVPNKRSVGFRASWEVLLELVRGGRLSVKLSAPYLSSKRGAPYEDLRPMVSALAGAAPDALLWGSNWPHTQGTGRSAANRWDDIEPFREEDDRAWLGTASKWLEARDVDPALMHSNAARLYEFG